MQTTYANIGIIFQNITARAFNDNIPLYISKDFLTGLSKGIKNYKGTPGEEKILISISLCPVTAIKQWNQNQLHLKVTKRFQSI